MDDFIADDDEPIEISSTDDENDVHQDEEVFYYQCNNSETPIFPTEVSMQLVFLQMTILPFSDVVWKSEFHLYIFFFFLQLSGNGFPLHKTILDIGATTRSAAVKFLVIACFGRN